MGSNELGFNFFSFIPHNGEDDDFCNIIIENVIVCTQEINFTNEKISAFFSYLNFHSHS